MPANARARTQSTSRRSPARSASRACSSRSSYDRSTADPFELVAGFHRLATAQTIGLAEVPVVIRDADSREADRGVENIARKQLNPYEETRAVKAMLDRGLTETAPPRRSAGRRAG